MVRRLLLIALSAAPSVVEGGRIQKRRARTSTWVISGSGCEMDGDCIQSNNYPSDYGNSEACTVELGGAVPLTIGAFDTESRYDFLTMGGTSYSGSTGPADGTYSGTISWDSDSSVTQSGWRICRSGPPVPTPAPTPAPPTPPTPAPPMVRAVLGGSVASGGVNNPAMDVFKGFPPGGVKFLTAASTSQDGGSGTKDWLAQFGIEDAEWIPVYGSNCASGTQNPEYVRMVEEADAIFIGGGQSGRVSSCLFGNYSQSGIDGGEETPLLSAIRAKAIVGGSSAGAMTQPSSEILVTAYSVESYSAVRDGSVFQRDSGSNLLSNAQAVDTHFSERGRQGRLVVFAMQTNAEWAFGVDEGTTYLWTPSGDYEVQGPNGVVIYQGTQGTPQSQTTTMHFLTSGDRINVNTGEITYNPDKTVCATGSAPSGSNSIFDYGGGTYRTVSIAAAQAPAGSKVRNFHGSPAVQVDFTKQAGTVAMCGPSGQSFGNLLVEQYQSATVAFVNTQKPNIPQDYMWLEDED